MRHVIPISGKDSLATAVVQRRRRPDLPYEYVFCDVGMELPETVAWMADVERHLGTKIARVGRPLEELFAEWMMLPSYRQRFCTKHGKVGPLDEWYAGGEVTQYVGIRSDEGDRIKANMRFGDNVTAVYPLIEEGVDLDGVYALLAEISLLPPSFFWKRLYDVVLDFATPPNRRYAESMEPWRRDRLFAWRSRSNCYMCFYQRLYEWVGLLEHHPDLFAEAERLEEKYGGPSPGRRSLGQFTLRYDGPLKFVRQRAAEIFRDRLDEVIKTLTRMRHAQIRGDDGPADALNLTSCGLYCGK